MDANQGSLTGKGLLKFPGFPNPLGTLAILCALVNSLLFGENCHQMFTFLVAVETVVPDDLVSTPLQQLIHPLRRNKQNVLQTATSTHLFVTQKKSNQYPTPHSFHSLLYECVWSFKAFNSSKILGSILSAITPPPVPHGATLLSGRVTLRLAGTTILALFILYPLSGCEGNAFLV